MSVQKILQFYAQLVQSFEHLVPSGEEVERQFAKMDFGYARHDPWGLDPQYCKKILQVLLPLYRSYFRVRVFGGENVQDKPYILACNHSGQIAIDGLLVSVAMVLDVEHPRIVRPMIERFMAELPFIAEASFRAGAVLGDRQNCLNLLGQGQSVLVFPEGVKGVAKATSQFYQLQPFTKGFLRIATGARKEILPVAIVGAEELYPFVYQAKGLAKFLGLPALPITPLFPWFGLIGAVPLPSPIDIYIGAPIALPEGLSEDAPDREIAPHLTRVEESIASMLSAGLEQRRKFIRPKKILAGLGIKS